MLSAKQQPSIIKHSGSIRPSVWILTFGPPVFFQFSEVLESRLSLFNANSEVSTENDLDQQFSETDLFPEKYVSFNPDHYELKIFFRFLT